MDGPIKIEIHGIKCDARGCGWRDNAVPFETYSEWVNKPCPKCGANLLTLEAHLSALKVMAIAAKINKFAGFLRKLGVKFTGGGIRRYKFEHDENGKPLGFKPLNPGSDGEE